MEDESLALQGPGRHRDMTRFAGVTELYEWNWVSLCVQVLALHLQCLWLFATNKFKKSVLCVSQPIKDERNNMMSGRVQYVMHGITTPSQSI